MPIIFIVVSSFFFNGIKLLLLSEFYHFYKKKINKTKNLKGLFITFYILQIKNFFFCKFYRFLFIAVITVRKIVRV
jgi:hypothetical protein